MILSRKAASPAGSNEDDEGISETTAAFLFQPKRCKVTSATFFKPRVPGEANQVPTPATAPLPKDEDVPHDDELAAYLSLPQVDWVSEWDALAWWEKNAKKFPNLSVMARQYLGCPATHSTHSASAALALSSVWLVGPTIALKVQGACPHFKCNFT